MRAAAPGAWLLAVTLALGALPAAAVELEGTWHVLVHYKDAEAAHPERERWEDRVWVFEREGSRLVWIEYPIVVFQDETGRFRSLGGNRAARELHFWEPNAEQLEQIAKGLEINTRGSKRKTLTGSDARGWSSGAAARARSASVITYSETWSAEGLGDRPVFAREDVLSSARAEGMEGRTEYRTEQVEAGGDVLRGRYDRDGTRSGTFVMRRAGLVSTVKGSGLTQSERVMQVMLSQAGIRIEDREALRALLERSGRGAPPEPLRDEIRREIEAALEEQVRAQGEDPRTLRPRIDQLTREIERLLVEEGKTLAEIRRMIEAGELAL